MRSLDDALAHFVYHPATPETAAKHAALRDLFVDLIPKVWDLLPDGPDKTVVIRAMEEALQKGNAAIAMTAAADTSATRSVARVLPGTPTCSGRLHGLRASVMADPNVGADVEIYEPVRDGEPAVVVPKRVRINGVDVGILAKDGLRVYRGNGRNEPMSVTLTLYPRTIWMGAEIEATD